MTEDKEKTGTGFVDWETRDNLEFDSLDLFDKIINLRLRAGNETEDTYIIRSDYEICSPDYIDDIVSGKDTTLAQYKGEFQRCKIKPSIKVQMRQVSTNTAIEIDIFIKNFYMLSKDGSVLMSFNAKNYPLKSVDVQMGYFGQFESYYSMNKNGLPTKEQFFDLDAPPDVRCVCCHIQYVSTESLPPDYTLHIHGYVGSCYNEAVYKENEDAFAQSEDTVRVVFSEVDNNKFKFENLAHYLFNNVTSRFFRRYDEGMDKSELSVIKQKVGKEDSFVLDEKTAKNYGVRVFMSECLIASNIFTGKYKYSSADGSVVTQDFFSYGIMGDSPMQSINKFISGTNNDIRAIPLNNGDYALYLKDEFKNPGSIKERAWFVYNNKAKEKTYSLNTVGGNKAEIKAKRLTQLTWAEIQKYIKLSLSVKGKGMDISDDDTLKKIKKSVGNIPFTSDILPCVYNINQDALATISCPYFTFLNTFDTVKFNSRYALGGLVDYYIDNSGRDTNFTVLWINYSFATVEDINECNIVALPKE